MWVPLSTVLVSGTLVLALVALFRYERVRGMRVAEDVRVQFDQTLAHVYSRTQQRTRELTGQTLRQSIHYLFHQLLTWILRTIHRLEAGVHSVAQFNKNRANRRTNSASPSHLSAIAEHKRNIQLSDSEKRHRREEALLGR